jgi:hypothetical protein
LVYVGGRSGGAQWVDGNGNGRFIPGGLIRAKK